MSSQPIQSDHTNAPRAVQAVTIRPSCEHCGQEFEPEPENIGKQRFCSNRCRTAWHRQQRDETDGTDGLYAGKVFQVSLRNVNIRAKSLKEGMKYEMVSEITEDDFDLIRSVDLTGSLFEAQLECIEVGQRELPLPETPPKPKGGALAQSAGVLCVAPKFQAFLRVNHAGAWADAEKEKEGKDAAGIAAELVRSLCGVASRAELDHRPEAGKRFRELMARYREWLANDER